MMKKILILLSLITFSLTTYAFIYGPWVLKSYKPMTRGYLCTYERFVYYDNGSYYQTEKREIPAVQTGWQSGAPVYQCMPPAN